MRFLRLICVATLAAAASACLNDPQVAPSTTASAAMEIPAAAPANKVTFVQWTDPHLFDAGTIRTGQGALEAALDNRAALHWAVIETNRLTITERRSIDFVVVTGDLGLHNVILPDPEGGRAQPCECPHGHASGHGPVAPVTLAEAANEIARELRALLVRNVYMVPGDADLCNADARDLHRWAQFVLALRREIAVQQYRAAGTLADASEVTPAMIDSAHPQVVDLTYTAERLLIARDPRLLAAHERLSPQPVTLPPVPSLGGITLLGLNSAFLAPHADAAITKANQRAAIGELSFVHSRIPKNGPFVLFTHVPDVPPSPTAIRRPSAKTQPVADANAGWALGEALHGNRKARELWIDDIVGAAGLIGVFGGHFHLDSRDPYPQTLPLASLTPPEGFAKFWWAPPLAAESHRPGEKSARGMLLVSVGATAGTRIGTDQPEPTPLWYATVDQSKVAEGDQLLTLARLAEERRDFAGATTTYSEALKHADPAIRASAMRGLIRVQRQPQWLWQLIGVVPKVSVAVQYPGVFAGAGLLVLLIVFLRWLSRRLVLLPAVDLDKDGPTAWVGAEIAMAQQEIVARLRREADAHRISRVHSGFAITAPAAEMTSIADKVPNVLGADAGGIVAFFASIWRYFGWTVKPAVVRQDLQPNKRITIIATRRFAWLDSGAWRATEEHPDVAIAIKTAARKVAAQIIGVQFSKKR